MAQQIINIGASPNDGQGNPIRTAFNKTNENFSELYSRAQTSPPLTLVGTVGDSAGMYAYDSSNFYYCFANYDGSSIIWAQVPQVGNISVSSIQNGNSNVSVIGANANVTIAIGGTTNVAVFSTTGAFVSGLISAGGNITGNYILGNGSQLTGLPESYSNVKVAAYLTTYTGNISAGNVLVSSAVSATGNVTSGNILTSGLVSSLGNIASQGAISAIGNITTAGYFVGTFVGNVTGNIVVPGSNTQVLFNTNGNADAVGGFTFDTNGPNLLTVLGTISSQGNVIAGNITTAGLVTATGNVIGGNIHTAGLITATGNIVSGNITTGGLLTVVGNVTGANLITGGQVLATGNVTGGNIITAGAISAGGNVFAANISGGNIQLTGTASVTGNVRGGNLLTAGAVSAAGITGTSLTVSTGNITCGNIVNANANGVGNIGSAGTYFNTVFAKSTSAQYADLAECYLADASYEPGTVVMFGGQQEVTVCDKDSCSAVVGVISHRPAYLMNSTLSGEHVAPVALMGRVPCKVQGTVAKGSLMISAGNGAARAEISPAPGTIIGKAVESFDGDRGVIEILVGRV